MSLFNFLTYLESAETNSKLEETNKKLDEIQSQAQRHKDEEESKEINRKLSTLFQNIFYGTEASEIDIGIVSEINEYMNKMFNKLKAIPAPRKILFIIETEAMKQQELDKEILLYTKWKHYEVSTYGVYVKYFLDYSLKDTKSILKNEHSDKNVTSSVAKLYRLFNLNTTPFELSDEEKRIIRNFNSGTISFMDSLEVKPTMRLPRKLTTVTFRSKVINNKIDMKKINQQLLYEDLGEFNAVLHNYGMNGPNISFSQNDTKVFILNLDGTIEHNDNTFSDTTVQQIVNRTSKNRKLYLDLTEKHLAFEKDADEFIEKINKLWSVFVYTEVDYGVATFNISIKQYKADQDGECDFEAEKTKIKIDQYGNIEDGCIEDLGEENFHKIMNFFFE